MITDEISRKASKASDYMQDYEKAFSDDNELDPDECIRLAEKKLEDIGYTSRCHGGTYRMVYENKSNNTVIKLALNKASVKENRVEIRNHTRISEAEVVDITGEGRCSGDKYIATIHAYETGANRWIIMERAEVTPDNVSKETAEKVNEALEREQIFIDEIDPWNMGRIEGDPVVFDYGGA